jgi:hypothetical protein
MVEQVVVGCCEERIKEKAGVWDKNSLKKVSAKFIEEAGARDISCCARKWPVTVEMRLFSAAGEGGQ